MSSSIPGCQKTALDSLGNLPTQWRRKPILCKVENPRKKKGVKVRILNLWTIMISGANKTETGNCISELSDRPTKRQYKTGQFLWIIPHADSIALGAILI